MILLLTKLMFIFVARSKNYSHSKKITLENNIIFLLYSNKKFRSSLFYQTDGCARKQGKLYFLSRERVEILYYYSHFNIFYEVFNHSLFSREY